MSKIQTRDLTVSSGAGKKISAMRNATDLREKVLQASLALIEEGGLDRFSMRADRRDSSGTAKTSGLRGVIGTFTSLFIKDRL